MLDLVLQSSANALSLGALFGLMGLSFGLIYSTSKILHFAHGATYICSAYLFYTMHVILNWPLVISALVSVVGAAAVGYAMMQGLYAPLLRRRTSGAVIMIASLGLFIVVENVIVLLFGNDSRVVSKASVQQGFAVGQVYVTQLQIWSFAIAIAVYVVIFVLITRTKLGRGLRGVADDAEVAVIVGISVDTMRLLIFAIGSAVLAVAAVLNSLDIGISPGMGLSVVLIATVAAVIGGASSLFGGILGGFVAGALQSFGVIWIDPRWQNLMIFSALIVILLVRPTGLLVAKR